MFDFLKIFCLFGWHIGASKSKKAFVVTCPHCRKNIRRR